MEGIKSSVVLFALLLAIFGPTVSFGNKRTCFCKSWWRPSGLEYSDGSRDTRLLDIPNRVYRGWPYLSCSKPKTWCPGHCEQNALATLGGSRSGFTTEAGNRVCSIRQQNESFPGLSVLAKYDVSNCGTTGTRLLKEHVCCAQRCSCNLTASMNNRPTVPLWSSSKDHPSPYHVCNDEEEIQSDCKNVCINFYRTFLKGSISPKYNDRSSSELCRMLGTTSHPPGARVYIHYGTMGVSNTVDLPKLCCFTVRGIRTTFPNPECVNIPIY